MLELETRSKKSLKITSTDLLNPDKAVFDIMQMLTNQSLRDKNVKLINSIRMDWSVQGKKYADLFREISER